ncbi:MOSC domain-containing protein [Pseudomonadota bacterium]|nr:MOSC domain-containing protein [Pseudomonadota bacterium]
MQVLSVNVSLPVDIEFNNKLISTSIFKKPIEGMVQLSEQQLKGDQQVDLENHGGGHKAVYAFSANEYQYWQQVLNKPDLHYGQFGENLTITKLDEATICIGDQLQINDCILEVTQPRIPCFKLGIALDDNSMPKRFIQHAATGIYFKVLQVGTLKAGDRVELIQQHPSKLPVKTLFKAYFDKDFIGAEQVMKQASEIVALSDEWREKVLDRLNEA